MNKVILSGRLTRDPEVRYAQSGNMAIAKYTLAVDRRFNREENVADFIPCTAFGKAGEFAQKYFRKGTKINIVGRLNTGSYKDRDGKTVYTTDVIIEEQEFAESKKSDTAEPEGLTAPKGYGDIETVPEHFMNISDSIAEELPFN